MLVLPPKKGCGDMPEMDAGEGAELGSRRGPFLVGVRAPSPGAQKGRPHLPVAQPELQGAGSLTDLGAPWWGRASASPGSAVWSEGSPFPSLQPSQGPAVLQEGQELLARVPLLKKPSLGTERVVGDPPKASPLPCPSPTPPKTLGWLSCLRYLELELQLSLQAVLLTLNGHPATQLHGHRAVEDPCNTAMAGVRAALGPTEPPGLGGVPAALRRG